MALKKILAATSALTVLGFITSFASLVVISYFFGTSAQLDAYWIAFAVMNVLASLAAPMREALVPEFHRLLQQDVHAAMSYFSRAMTLILLVALGGMLIAWGYAEPLASLTVNSNNPEIRFLAVHQIYWMAPAIMLLVVSETLNSLLAAYHRVIFQSVSRLLGTLISLVLLGTCSGFLDAHILPVAFIGAQVVTIIVQACALHREGLKFRIRWPSLDAKFILVSGSLLISYVASQMYVLLEKHTLTFFESGLVSSFQYAVSLTNVIVTLVGITISSVLWPRMLGFASTNAHENMFSEVMLTTRLMFLALGCLCGLVWLNASTIVTMLFARGAFGASDIPRAAWALQVAVFASLPISVGFVVGKALLSMGAARSLMATGLTIALAGVSCLLIARIAESETLALGHWVLANTVGLGVQLLLLKRFCSINHEIRLLLGLKWLLKWVGALILGMAAANLLVVIQGSNIGAIQTFLLRSSIFILVYGVASWFTKLLHEYLPLLKRPVGGHAN